MHFIRYTLLLFAVSAWIQSQGQTPTNVLQMNKQKYITEVNKYEGNKTVAFLQEVNYNEPYVVDEEHTHELFFRITDTSLLKRNTMIYIRDTARFVCHYSLTSVWKWSMDSTEMTGNIKILSVGKKRISISFDLLVITKSRELTYIGKRTFKRSTGVKSFHPEYNQY